MLFSLMLGHSGTHKAILTSLLHIAENIGLTRILPFIIHLL